MDVFYVLLILLLVTTVCADIAIRLKQPALVGELVGGVLVGLAIRFTPDADISLAEVTTGKGFESLIDLAIFFLMLVAGLEMRPKDLAGATRQATPVAIAGMLVPFMLGFGLGWWWLPESDWKLAQCLFLGVAPAITAVPVAVKVLMDLGKLQTKLGQIVVAAAVLDDIMSLILLAILTAVMSASEQLSFASVLIIGGKIALFFVLVIAARRYLLPLLSRFIHHVSVGYPEFTLILLFGLLLAVLAELLEMHFMLGAFAAGVVFTRSLMGEDTFSELRTQFEAVTLGFLAPVFFASIGIHLDLRALVEIPGFFAAVLGLAMFGKIVGAGLTARAAGVGPKNSLAIGAAMNARGAVGIIIADIALRAGLFEQPDPTPPVIQYMFSAIVLMAIITTLTAPVMLRSLLINSDDA